MTAALAAILPTGDWVHNSRCTPDTAHLWIGSKYRPAEAKAICSTCPVIVQCRAEAIRTEQQYGVWGGIDFADKRVQRKARREARKPPTADPRCGTEAGCPAHYRRNEKPCDPCQSARREGQRARRAQQQEN